MFLPISRSDMNVRDWHYLDFLIISGDAIVDHYSFGSPLIGRWLESLGYRVGIIAQPDWHDPEAVKVMGKPRYGVLISAGNMDSMLNHYTATKKPRRQDAYSPGGKAGLRPDYATVVYSKLVRQAFGDEVPIILGGVEASLRRFAHYDFWQDKVLPSVLVESGADLLVYGMAEKALAEVAAKLAAGKTVAGCNLIAGVAYVTKTPPPKKTMEIPSLQQVTKSKNAFAKAFVLMEKEQNFYDGKTLVQRHDDEYLVVNPPAKPLTTKEMDRIYSLPFENTWHPDYDKVGGIPAFKEIEFSILSHRGCFGGCSFCSINFHQGGIIQNRSDQSILDEAKRLTEKAGFKGYIHDLGGPTANFRHQGCDKAKKRGNCRNQHCLYPEPCKSLKPNQMDYIKLLQQVAAIPTVKKVFIRSGIRYDYVMADRRDDFLKQLCQHNVSGLLKVAPEHSVPHVLAAMGKPSFAVYTKFQEKFNKMNKAMDKKQFILPYFIAAHPGSRLEDAVDLAMTMKHSGLQPEQVQLFIPTPGSRSTCMFYTGINPMTMKPIYVPRTDEERDMQRALLQVTDKKNFSLVRKALAMIDREDLIGFGQEYLVPPSQLEIAAGTYKQVKRKEAVNMESGKFAKGNFKGKAKSTKDFRGKNKSGGKKDFGDKQEFKAKREFKDNEEYKNKKEYSPKKDFGGKKDFGESKEYQGKRDFKDSKNYQGKKEYSPKKDFSGKKDFGESKEYQGKRDFKDSKNYQGKKEYTSKKDFGGKKDFGESKEYQGKRDFKDSKNYQGKKEYSPKKDFGGKKDFGESKTYKGKNDYSGKKDYNDKKKYGDATPKKKPHKPNKFKPEGDQPKQSLNSLLGGEGQPQKKYDSRKKPKNNVTPKRYGY